MKTHLLLATLAGLAGSLLAANAAPKDDVTAAARKLADQDNYAWKRTTDNAGGGPSGTRSSEGKVEKAGYLWLTMPLMRTNTLEAITKGEKGAIKTGDVWQSLAEAAGSTRGPAAIGARMVKSFKAPAAEAEELAGKVKELKQDGDVYSGELTEEEAQARLMSGGGGRARPNASLFSGAKGSVKFWVKDGVLTRYQIKVQAKVSLMGKQRDDDRTTTVEIKDVGSTKVQVPEDAMKKLS